ncbi:caspase family protein [Streptomyces sp. NPDC058459]|uniref:caspase family protein n=1 Tax=Streptomyces sp. NPDC058459 TaxID=3346508 RepID=UPI0036535EDB
MPVFDPRGEVNRALLVGVSTYDSVWPDDSCGVPGQLGAVAHNVSLLAQALRRGGVFHESEVAVVDSPYLDGFSESLRGAVDEAQGLLLFYYAGHGALPSAGDELWLQMRNSRVVPGSKAVFPGADPFSSVLTVLATSRARHVVVILDCCNAGNAAQVCEALADRHRFSVLMSVQANHRIDAGDTATPTPFTAALVRLLEERDGEVRLLPEREGRLLPESEGRLLPEREVRLLPESEGRLLPEREGDGDVTFRKLAESLTAHMSAGYRTLRKDAWEPQRWGEQDVVLAGPPTRTSPRRPPAPPMVPWWRALPARTRPAWGVAVSAARRVVALFAAHLRTVLAAALVLLAGTGGYLAFAGGDPVSCRPPLELRLLTDPDLEVPVRHAAGGYLMSEANRTAEGCRRSGITVYSAGASETVTGFLDQADHWQIPGSSGLDPQRDIGPQPDIWIPATSASVRRTQVIARRPIVTLVSYGPLAYSPTVLAVPQDIAGASVADRTGAPLGTLVKRLTERRKDADVRRADPEYTDAALLATVGLYGKGAAMVSEGEASVAQSGLLSPTGGDLLCTLSDRRAADGSSTDTDDRTAALVPEFLLARAADCDGTLPRVRRMAEYPTDIPPLDPAFVQVDWEGGDRDRQARDEAVRRFHDWLTREKDDAGGPAGLSALGEYGFRDVHGAHDRLGPPGRDTGTLSAPGRLPAPSTADAMATALEKYRRVNGPGRVLFLLDSSGSMGTAWEGPSGAPGILNQSLGGLGADDEYGVWAVAARRGGPYRELLPLRAHVRAEAEKAVDGAAVQDAEADPYGALSAAIDVMKAKDDGRPQMIVYLTDDEDNDHLARHLQDLRRKAEDEHVPVVMAALDSGGCDKGKPDTVIARASGGRCLDTGHDLATGLSDEVARTGTGDQ